MRENSDELVGRKKRSPLYKVGAWLLVLQVLLVSLVTDVVPANAAGMGQQKTFTTTESTNQTQTQTFTIPGLKKLNGATVNTGNAEVISVVGDQVTVRTKDGVRTRREQTGGVYTPASTQSESDSRTNTTGSFPASIVVNRITLTKDGSVTSVQTGGSYDPGGTKYPSANGYGLLGYTKFEVRKCGHSDTCLFWDYDGEIKNNTVYYEDSDGYKGNLSIEKWYFSDYSGFFDVLPRDQYVLGNRIQLANYGNYFAPYNTVTKPATDTRTYNYTQKYIGTKTIPATDTRTYRDYYQYAVTFDYEGDTTPPTIVLTANPTAPTNQDVTITAKVKDVEKTTFNTDESTNSTQTQTFIIPQMKKLDKVTVNSGNIEVVSVKGNDVTVKVSGGIRSSRVQTGGVYTPPTTSPIVVTEGTSTNRGGNPNFAATKLHTDGTTILYFVAGSVRFVGYGNDNGGGSQELWQCTYAGTVSNPGSDTRTYADYYQYAITFEYDGEIASKKWAEGLQDIGYFKTAGETLVNDQFTVSENGMYTVYARDAAGNEAVETIKIGNIYKDPPTITLKANPVTLTNKDVVVMARVVSPIGIVEKKWAKGNHDTVYFEKKGTALGGSFKVTENGMYTAFAKDKVGNVSVKTITITNINKIPPAIPTFTATPTTETKGPVTVTIHYSGESVLKQYRTVTGTGSGVWKEYLEPVSLTRNGIVEARGQDQAGNWSAVSRIVITNIVKENNGGNPPGDGSGSGGNYEVPLQQKPMDDSGMKGSNRTFKAEFVSDLLFTTKYTGFMTGYPYANKVRESILNGGAMPSFNAVVNEGTAKSKTAYESKTGQTFKDEWMFTESEENVESLQRYAIPITPLSDLKPGETYHNDMELVDMGLSDLGFEYDQTFSFEHYLFGSGADEAWVIEQPESRVKVDSADVKTIVITKEQRNKIIGEVKERPTEDKLHNFRVTDRNFTETIRKIVGF